jgi:hypothetical protein
MLGWHPTKKELSVAMTTVTPTFQEIEARTETAVAFAILAKRIRDHVQAIMIGSFVLPLLARRLEALSRGFKSGVLDQCTEKELGELAELLRQLHSQVLKLTDDADSSGISNVGTVSGALLRIRETNEDLHDILEGIYLTLDSGFHKVMSSAIDKLNLGVKESATLPR